MVAGLRYRTFEAKFLWTPAVAGLMQNPAKTGVSPGFDPAPGLGKIG
jgi:hypothetical protein